MCRQAATGAPLSWITCQEAVTSAWVSTLPHRPKPLSHHSARGCLCIPVPSPASDHQHSCSSRLHQQSRLLLKESSPTALVAEKGPQRCCAWKREDSQGTGPAGCLLCSGEQSSKAQRLVPTCHFPSWGHGAVFFSNPINFHCLFFTAKAWGGKTPGQVLPPSEILLAALVQNRSQILNFPSYRSELVPD